MTAGGPRAAVRLSPDYPPVARRGRNISNGNESYDDTT
jgi:hypothetical protein